jgi:HD-GYP domain-containing protein (c-di-GMP phosphodiesterase class II)
MPPDTRTGHRDAPLPAALRSAIQAFAAAQRDRDPVTWQHQERTAQLAVAIGTRLGLPGSRLEMLRLAAMVHDIGKVGLLADVVGKPGDLTAPEFALVQTHCAIGYGILQTLESPSPLPEIVFQHHERLDGSGYPRGLAGEAILAEARILAVADAFDAMISPRGYRAALPEAFVIEELKQMSGRTLDRDAVEACVEHVRLRAEAVSAPAPPSGDP